MLKMVLFLLFFSSFSLTAQEQDFEGRISHINDRAGLLKVKINFENMRFLNPKEKMNFWVESYPSKKCTATLQASSADYYLIQVEDYNKCTQKVSFNTGSSLRFFSEDLVRNKKEAQKLVDILLKKRLAISSLLGQTQLYGAYGDKVDEINNLYRAKMAKLEEEWAAELEALKSAQNVSTRDMHTMQTQLDEIDHLLEKYRLRDPQIQKDRWALDKKIFSKR